VASGQRCIPLPGGPPRKPLPAGRPNNPLHRYGHPGLSGHWC